MIVACGVEVDDVANMVSAYTVASQFLDLFKLKVLFCPLSKGDRLSFCLLWTAYLAGQQFGLNNSLLFGYRLIEKSQPSSASVAPATGQLQDFPIIHHHRITFAALLIQLGLEAVAADSKICFMEPPLR